MLPYCAVRLDVVVGQTQKPSTAALIASAIVPTDCCCSRWPSITSVDAENGRCATTGFSPATTKGGSATTTSWLETLGIAWCDRAGASTTCSLPATTASTDDPVSRSARTSPTATES